jgi:large subunit ribosomal protein L10
MNRDQKSQVIENMRGALTGAPLVILAEFQGSTVAELNSWRRACEAGGIQFQVVKNSLCRIAVGGTPLEGLSGHFKGNVAIIVSGEDAVATAKLFNEKRKTSEKVRLKAGYFDGDVIDEKGVEMVASLPSREQLLSTLLVTVQEGPRQVMGVVQGPARDLMYLLQNFADSIK